MEMSPDPPDELFTVYIFEEQRDTLATPLPAEGHAKRRNGTKRQSKEASLYNNGLVLLLCGGYRNYESIKTAATGKKLACLTHC